MFEIPWQVWIFGMTIMVISVGLNFLLFRRKVKNLDRQFEIFLEALFGKDDKGAYNVNIPKFTSLLDLPDVLDKVLSERAALELFYMQSAFADLVRDKILVKDEAVMLEQAGVTVEEATTFKQAGVTVDEMVALKQAGIGFGDLRNKAYAYDIMTTLNWEKPKYERILNRATGSAKP